MADSPPLPDELDREGLYRLAWSVPMSRLALHFQISDVGLSKFCRRWEIPTPGRGYWAKLAAGQKVRRTPLPRRAPTGAIIRRTGSPLPETTSMPQPANPSILSAANLDAPHPLTKIAAEQLRIASASQTEVVRTDPATAPDIEWPREGIDRVLRLLDGILRAWEAAGGKALMSTVNDRPSATLELEGERLGFSLGLYVPEGPRPGRPGPREPRPTLWFETAAGDRCSAPLRDRWSENVSTSLEKLIRPALNDAAGYLRQLHTEKRDGLIRIRQQKQAQARVTQDRQSDDEALRLRQELGQLVDRWHDAQRIRAFLDALKSKISAGTTKPKDPPSFDRWLKWAEQYADWVDPTMNRPPTEPGRQPVINTPTAQIDLTSRTRTVLDALSIKDSDALELLDGATLKSACQFGYGDVWREITDVLTGLGYDTTARSQHLW